MALSIKKTSWRTVQTIISPRQDVTQIVQGRTVCKYGDLFSPSHAGVVWDVMIRSAVNPSQHLHFNIIIKSSLFV